MKVREFVTQDGNGFMRTPPPSAVHLELTLGAPIPFDHNAQAPGKGPLTPIAAKGPSIRKILLSEGLEPYAYDQLPAAYRRWAERHNPLMMPDRRFLHGVHRSVHDSFLNRRSTGFVVSVDKVAGNLPHHVSSRPRIEPWDSRGFHLPTADIFSLGPEVGDGTDPKREAPRNPVWLMKNLELVSLLKHTRPVAYCSEYLPRMDQLRSADTRELDDFESRGLEQLYSGQYLVFQSRRNEIRMMGAIRGSKTCLVCHDIRRGEMLGAFTYTLRRAKPTGHHATNGSEN